MIDEGLAELCGIILGDGHMHTDCNRIIIAGSLEDIYYYNQRVIPLFQKYFIVNPRLSKLKTKNCYHLAFESKEMFNTFLNIGLKRGRKTDVAIPNVIKNNVQLYPSFMRGLFDTDGCLRFSKQMREIGYYPRIQYGFKITPFSLELNEIFETMKFKTGKWFDKRKNGHTLLCYQISGKENLERWMKVVGMGNPVQMTKYLFWKKYGYYVPRMTLEERLKRLELDISIAKTWSIAP